MGCRLITSERVFTVGESQQREQRHECELVRQRQQHERVEREYLRPDCLLNSDMVNVQH